MYYKIIIYSLACINNKRKGRFMKITALGKSFYHYPKSNAYISNISMSAPNSKGADIFCFKGASSLSDKASIVPSSNPTDLEYQIEKNTGITPVKTVVKKFKNGETYVNISGNIRGKDVYIMPSSGDNVNDRLHITSRLSDMNIRRIQHSIPGGSWRDWPEELLLQCHKNKKGQTYTSVYGRMCWDDVAPTITTQFTGYGTGRFGHPEQDRALTLREGAIIQTFPKDYAFLRPNEKLIIKDISRQIGNAVPPRLGEVIGLSIIQHYQKRVAK